MTFIEQNRAVCALGSSGDSGDPLTNRQLCFEEATISVLARQLVTTRNTVSSHIKLYL